jgi:hypothetical protein
MSLNILPHSISQMSLSKHFVKKTFNQTNRLVKETILKRNSKSFLPIIDEEEEKDLIAAGLSFKVPPHNSKEMKSKGSYK